MESSVPRLYLNTFKKNCDEAIKNQNYVLAYRICQGLLKLPKASEFSRRILKKLQSNPEIVRIINQQNSKLEPGEKIKLKLLNLFHLDDKKAAYETCISELEFFPNSIFTNHMAAQLAERIGEISRASSYYSKALTLDPLNSTLLRNFGVFLCTHRNVKEGRNHLYLCKELEPKNTEIIILLANLENRHQNYHLEEKHWQQLVNNGSLVLLHYGSLFNCLLEQGKISSAKKLLGKIEILFKKSWMINVFRAYMQSYEGHLQEAVETLETVNLTEESSLTIYNELGNLYKKMGKNSVALQYLEEALKIQPENPLVRWNLSYIYLSTGKFEKGWEFYEARWDSKGWTTPYFQTEKPVWKGEENCTIFIWKEQGIGDEIMFLSLLRCIPESIHEIIIQCDKRLTSMIKRAEIKRVRVLENDLYNEAVDFDYHIPIGSLCYVLGLEQKSISNNAQPYLIADKNLVAELQPAFDQKRNKRIGISWKSTNSLFKNQKDIPLPLVLEKITREDITIVNLQYGNIYKDLKKVENKFLSNFMIFNEIDKFSDLERLAALIRCCDMIITSSNVTVHLASALGVPCHLIINEQHDWKWFSDYETSYWYPKCVIHIYRNFQELEHILENLNLSETS